MNRGYRRYPAIRLLLAALLAWAPALAGPGDNSLVVAAGREPVLLGDFWGIASNSAVASEIENYLWAGLEYTDIDGEDRPYLATEAPTVANGRVVVSDLGGGRKRVAIHYTLRPDARWSDGVPITSDDVRFYYEVGSFPGAPVPDPSYWERIGLSVQDERNFTVTFEPAYFYDLAGPAIGLAPAHVLRGAWEEARARMAGLDPQEDADEIAAVFRDFVAGFAAPAALNRGSLVYSGPFVLKRWSRGKNLELRRNPDFFITPPGGPDKYVGKVVYRFIPDANAMTVALLGGGVDATSSGALTLEQARAPQLTRRARGRFDIWAVPAALWEHAEVNKFTSVRQARDLKLDDPRTRQALLYAMNRQGLVEAFFDGLQPVASTWVHPADPAAASVKSYPYDPEKARRLLAELGWRDLDGDGWLERRTDDGRTVRFELEYLTTADNPVRERTLAFFADDLKKVGVKVVAKSAPAATVFAPGFFYHASEGSWKGLFEFSWFLKVGDDAGIFTCNDYLTGETNVPTPKNGFKGVNFGWCNERFDRLRARALVEFDEARRREYWRQMQEIWAEELPSLPLYWRAEPLVVKKGLVNYAASASFGGLGYPSTTAWLIGWSQNGAQQVYDQSRYAASVLKK